MKLTEDQIQNLANAAPEWLQWEEWFDGEGDWFIQKGEREGDSINSQDHPFAVDHYDRFVGLCHEIALEKNWYILRYATHDGLLWKVVMEEELEDGNLFWTLASAHYTFDGALIDALKQYG